MRHFRDLYFSIACLNLLLATGLLHCGKARAESIPVVPIAMDGSALQTPAIRVLSPTSAVMEDVALAGSRLVAGGEHGLIVYSDDNGLTWQQSAVPVDVTITDIEFATPKIGWAVGNFGVVLGTDDGGTSWVSQFDGIKAASLLVANANQALTATPNDPVLLHDLKLAKRTVGDGPDRPFFVVEPFSATHVRIFGASNFVFDSVDGGQTWTDWSSHLNNPEGLHPYGAASANGNTIITGEQGMLLEGPTDGALAAANSPSEASFFGILRNAAGDAAIFGLQGEIFLSRDEGKTWLSISNSAQVSLNCGGLTDNGQMIFGDAQGTVSVLTAQTLRPVINVGFPIISLAEATDRSLIVVGFGGIRRIAPADFASAMQVSIEGTKS